MTRRQINGDEMRRECSIYCSVRGKTYHCHTSRISLATFYLLKKKLRDNSSIQYKHVWNGTLPNGGIGPQWHYICHAFVSYVWVFYHSCHMPAPESLCQHFMICILLVLQFCGEWLISVKSNKYKTLFYFTIRFCFNCLMVRRIPIVECKWILASQKFILWTLLPVNMCSF